MTKEVQSRFAALETQIQDLKCTVRNLKQTPIGSHICHCPQCGNPVLLNANQFERRKDIGRAFYCSAGHSFSFY